MMKAWPTGAATVVDLVTGSISWTIKHVFAHGSPPPRPPAFGEPVCASPNDGYPLYQLGGPQLRVFRTNFFIKLVRPGTAQPEDTVQFRIPMEMTRVDLRNYLERIYNVPVAAVRTRVQHGSNRKRDHRNVRIKKPDYKVAYVQLICLELAKQASLPLLGPSLVQADVLGAWTGTWPC
uniref:39S ribosomal protein L23, mitochondrial isoform X4 n=1 Tax=Jaculus jaculus TaxID=51337 RepID=UPI001E1B2A34|nr:39S ribosomal protein L23, mitochondrial isoform X4 [Jaculus jaculus]